ncbi:hypothetical protein FB45DRAFT_922835 [Roridomyces roridus]|uniref:RRM domain-containing protein n=1 Tax=Roridomyces roridus TaxID=1738132 RepID=A0AAD7BND6_9AGAR|nr:hypothetical protein FB45DRAFT_922835 [Roridomyces roridus]
MNNGLGCRLGHGLTFLFHQTKSRGPKRQCPTESYKSTPLRLAQTLPLDALPLMAVTRSSKKPVARMRAPAPPPRRPNVFRCPSPSPTPEPSPQASSSKKKKELAAPVASPTSKEPVPGPFVPANNTKGKERKTASKKHADLVKAVGVAFNKKRAKERAAGGPVRQLAEPWVAVGNLDPQTTEVQLKEHFAHAGKVKSASIRYSTGAVDQTTGLPGYTYALVYFNSRAAAHDALLLGGTRVGESTYDIVVSLFFPLQFG